MKSFIVFFLLSFPFLANCQGLHGDLYAGFANYQGDLQGKRFTFKNSGPALGLGLSYDLTNKLIVRGAATYLKVGADDKDNTTATGITFRNLRFKSNILEAQLALEYNIFDLAERSFTPYVFAGIAAYHFNPFSEDSLGNRVLLRPLSTEGQGLPQYPDKKVYNNKQLAIPFGGGVKFVLSEKVQVSIEVGLRKLFTDYLDDVSTTYADSAFLFASKGQRAVDFAYRGNEIKGAPPYPVAGSQRGNAKNKDWYYTTGIKLSYLFGGGGGNGGKSSRKNKTGCPVNVY
ncbi:MAG: DUF6089 family protein [Ferruginibacter sp.]